MTRHDPSSSEIIGLYRRHGLAWGRARKASPFLERPWIERFAGLLPAGGTVLDIGCGTGAPIAHFLKETGFRVTGVDASEPMIAFAREAMPGQTWAVCDMRTLALDHTFDGLIAWHSFFHLTQDDQRAMFAVFARHAGPSAVLMFTSGPRAGEALGELGGETLYHASLDPDEYRTQLQAIGFGVVDHVAEEAASGGATIWLARRGG